LQAEVTLIIHQIRFSPGLRPGPSPRPFPHSPSCRCLYGASFSAPAAPHLELGGGNLLQELKVRSHCARHAAWRAQWERTFRGDSSPRITLFIACKLISMAVHAFMAQFYTVLL